MLEYFVRERPFLRILYKSKVKKIVKTQIKVWKTTVAQVVGSKNACEIKSGVNKVKIIEKKQEK